MTENKSHYWGKGRGVCSNRDCKSELITEPWVEVRLVPRAVVVAKPGALTTKYVTEDQTPFPSFFWGCNAEYDGPWLRIVRVSDAHVEEVFNAGQVQSVRTGVGSYHADGEWHY